MLLCLLLLSSARSLAPVPNCIRYRQSISHGHGWRHTGTTCQLSLHSNRSVASWPLPSATCVPYPNPHDARHLISFISPAPLAPANTKRGVQPPSKQFGRKAVAWLPQWSAPDAHLYGSDVILQGDRFSFCHPKSNTADPANRDV